MTHRDTFGQSIKSNIKDSTFDCGQATKNVRSDDFEAECRALDKYLVDLLAHPLFGTSQVRLFYTLPLPNFNFHTS